MIERQRSFAGLRLADGDPGAAQRSRERLAGLAVQHSAARDYERSARARIAATARSSIAGSGAARGMCQTRFSNISAG